MNASLILESDGLGVSTKRGRTTIRANSLDVESTEEENGHSSSDQKDWTEEAGRFKTLGRGRIAGSN